MGANAWKVHNINLCLKECANRGNFCNVCIRFSNYYPIVGSMSSSSGEIIVNTYIGQKELTKKQKEALKK